jgi:hypothetical protein
MGVSLGAGETGCTIALLPNEVALYVHYGVLPVMQPGSDAVEVSGFLSARVSQNPTTGMGCLCLDPAWAFPWSVAQVREQWPASLDEARRLAGASGSSARYLMRFSSQCWDDQRS